MESILISIKKLLGIDQSDINFDTDVIIDINSVLLNINQYGIGPETGFIITGETETWADLLGDRKDLEAVKTFVYLKVRLIFDPPANAFVVEAMQRSINEFEWRLTKQAEPVPVVEPPTTTYDPFE